METEVIDKLFLELSQVTKATTKRELDLQAKIEAMSLPDEAVDLRLLMDCRTELRNERKERRDDREDAEAEIETLREILSIREGQLEYCRKDAERMQKEIEILQESCRRREDRASEASHQASVLANVCADQKREIERLKKYADALHEDKMNALLEVHKIREALNGVLFAEKS